MNRGEALGDWEVAHRELSRLAQLRAGLDLEEGRWLLAALRGGVHARLGYGSFIEYVERLFGYGPKLIQEKTRVAEALEGLPQLSRALQDGQACWSVLRELTRVATADTEEEWLAAARNKTVREVERLVSGHAVGDRPTDERDARLERHVLRFEVSGEVLATFREAIATLRRDAGGPLSDEEALLLMARQTLEGPKDTGRASYQVALNICPDCQQATQQGRGEQAQVGADIAEMATCDGQLLPHGVASGRAQATQDVPPSVRREVLRRDGGCCVFPGCRHSTYVDVHHLQLKSEEGTHTLENLVTVCAAHHRALHRGRVFISGAPSTGLRFRHADGSTYGATVVPHLTDTMAKAFRALRQLGFREADTRRALTEAAHVGASGNVEAIVRHCLLVLTKHQAKAS